MEHIRESDETLMDICAEAPGCFEIDPESGEPLESCVYSELIQLGYTSDSLASADGKDSASINYLYNLIYPDSVRDQPIDKAAVPTAAAAGGGLPKPSVELAG